MKQNIETSSADTTSKRKRARWPSGYPFDSGSRNL